MNEHFIRTKHKVLELLDSREKGAKLIREYIGHLENHIEGLEKIVKDYEKMVSKFTKGGKK